MTDTAIVATAETSPADIVRAAWASAYIQTPALLDRLSDDEVMALWERHMREDLSPHLFDDGSDRKQAYRKRGDEIIANYLMLRTAAAA